MASFWKNLITFGAAQRVENAAKENRKLLGQYNSLLRECANLNDKAKSPVKEFIKLQVKAQKQAKKMERFLSLKEFRNGTLSGINSIPQNDIKIVSQSISNGDIALSSLKGISTGVAAPAALFSIVSQFGVASTGVSIASLSGVAATNATYAAIGGGSIAAGGGGIALGSTILNVLPGLGIGVAALSSHLIANRKIKEIELNSNEIVKAIDKMEIYKMALERGTERLEEELIPALKKAIKAYKYLYWKTYFRIFPLGPISEMFKGKGGKLGPNDQKKVFVLFSVAKNMLKIRDTKVFS